MQKILAILFTLGMLAACGEASNSAGNNDMNSSVLNAGGKAESPDITITVNGQTDGRAGLIGMFGDQQYTADTASIRGGVIKFKRKLPYDQGIYYVVLPDNKIVQIVIAQDQTFSITTEKANLVPAAVVEGSVENEILYRNLKYQAIRDPEIQNLGAALKNMEEGTPRYEEMKAKRDALLEERGRHLDSIFTAYPDALFTKYKKAGQNPEVREVWKEDGSPDKLMQVYYYRKEFWDNVDFSDQRLLYTNVIGNKLKRYMTELTPQHPDSIKVAADDLLEKVLDKPEFFKYIANWITIKFEPTKTTLMDAEAVFVHMIQNYFTNERAFWSDSAQVQALQMRAHEMSKSLVGLKAPNVKVPGLDGKVKELYDIKSPYIIVYLFNPTCEHCMKETPQLVQFHKQWKARGVEVYAIAIDTDDAEWRAYVNEKGMHGFTNVFDPTNRSIYATYYVDNTPELYVLNPDREIIGKNLKVNQVETVINRDKEKR